MRRPSREPGDGAGLLATRAGVLLRTASGVLYAAAALMACGDRAAEGLPAPTRVAEHPSELREVRGQIIDRSGAPLPNVSVRSVGFHPDQVAAAAVTNDLGEYVLSDLRDVNTLLQVEAEGFYPEVVPVFLQGLDAAVQLEPLALVDRQSGRIRLWLAGDTMFARRFENRDEDADLSEVEDLIHPQSRADDAYQLFHYLLPALGSADHRMLNFESPASLHHESRHPHKQFSFSSHPETLSALKRAGIDAVSLGNNHSYDYLEAGRIETEYALRRRGIDFFGSGASQVDARQSLHEIDVNGVPLSFQGFNGIKPGTYYPDPDEPWETKFLYYALDEPKKGGSLLLDRDNLRDFMNRSPERLRIPVMHGGEEYGELPTGTMRDRFEQAHEAGAKLVVAHHSHTVYGVALWGPLNDPSVSLLSLGNFIFDQDVFETFNSFMAVLDLEMTSVAQYRLLQLRLIPFHQEAYVPSLTSGRQAELLARRVGHISTFLPERPEDDLRPAVAFKDAAGIGVMLRSGEYAEQALSREREVELADGESEIISLNRGRGAADYFTGFETPGAEATLRLARDLLVVGDFEDYDLDGRLGENHNWWQTETRYTTTDQARSGRHSLALYRAAGTETPVNTQLRNRITFQEGAELSLMCHFMGNNAGAVSIVAKYIQRNTRTQIGEEELASWNAGTYGWTQRHAVLHPTPGAGHVRFVITLQPSGLGGALYVDDCALLSWGPTLTPGQAVAAPHAYEWARLTAPGISGALDVVEQRRIYSRVYSAK